MANNLILIGWGMAAGWLIVAAVVYWHSRRKAEGMMRGAAAVREQGRQKAIALIEDARDRAVKIITSAQVSAESQRKEVKKELDKISAEQLRELQRTLANVSEGIQSSAVKEIDEFKQALEIEAVGAQRAVADKAEKYKDEQLAKVDRQIWEIIKTVAKEVTGKTVTPEDHKELVMQALQEAKKQHVF